MDHKIFQYGLIQGMRGFSSLNNDNVAYLTRNGTVGSVRNDDGRFLAVLQPQLHRFDIEKQHIQHISTKTGFEVYIQFSGWRRFVELSWEGDSCRATAELPKGLKNVNVQLRKCTTAITLGTASPEPLTYALDDRDIYTILFDPAMYEGFVVVFSADDAHQTDMRAISKPLAYRGSLCEINDARSVRSARSNELVCMMKIRPELLRVGSRGQDSHDTDTHDEPADNITRTSAQVLRPANIEEIEKRMQTCLSENRTSPYELAELFAHQDAFTTLSATYEDTTIDFFETNMDNMDQYQIVDTYLLSIISLSFIFLFIYLKFDAAWSKNTCLVALAIVWIILELLAFILLSLQMSGAIKLPGSPLGSMCEVLITLSLWGIGTLQILAVIFPIGNGADLEMWAMYAVAFECIEVIIVVALIFVPQVTVHSEIACVVPPLTSQVITIAILYRASRGIQGHSTPRRTAVHHIWAGLAVIIISMVLAVLSASGKYPSLGFFQGILYMESSVMGLRPAEQERLNRGLANRHPGIPLTSHTPPDSTSSLHDNICRPASYYTSFTPRRSPC
ncbi:uncharacterized protein FTOL_10090 [Fusarium torulosum]|uniref:Uncharacterized protein n=1 Tax=Fusarium torulosum TaxID=33205 RepID=A0AAE8SLK1_9HYPO|nr:uncharacterized protein FTOL_10090 [Fusarium torulosum]